MRCTMPTSLLSLAGAGLVAVFALSAGPPRTAPSASETPSPADPPVHGTATFGHVRRLHDSAIHGDLTALRAAATWLADREPIPTRGSTLSAELESLRRAARRVAAAKDVSQVAADVAAVAAACGTCHEAAAIQPRLPAFETVWNTRIVGHMRRHARAADEMIQGMVMPSSRLWLEGTTAFAENPLEPGDFPVDVQRGDAMARLEAHVHRLAQNAFVAETPAARARAYGQLLAACAGCHSRHTRP